MDKKSPIDLLYERIMGESLSKSGTAYEKISAAVLGLLLKGKARHNQFIEGCSQTKYQLDGLIDDSTMVESKDYTIRNEKVGRGDLQKLQGALSDLPKIGKGIFTSATDYTTPALKYAKGSTTNPMQKPIIPVEIRESTEDDLKNRIQTIKLQMVVKELDYEKGQYEVIYSDGEQTRLNSFMESNGYDNVLIPTYNFFDSNGKVVKSMNELSQEQYPKYDCELKSGSIVEGEYKIHAFIRLFDDLYQIEGIKYRIPIVEICDTIIIEANGDATILVKSDVLGINTIVTDKDLKESIFKLNQ